MKAGKYLIVSEHFFYHNLIRESVRESLSGGVRFHGCMIIAGALLRRSVVSSHIIINTVILECLCLEH